MCITVRCEPVYLASNMVDVFLKYPTPCRYLPAPVKYNILIRILFQGHHSFPNRPMNEYGPNTHTQSPITTGAAVFAMKEPVTHFEHMKPETFFTSVARFTYLGVVPVRC
jgi:hypothetical protein